MKRGHVRAYRDAVKDNRIAARKAFVTCKHKIGVSAMTGYRIIALVLIAAGLTLVPWYALQSSFYEFKWFANFSGKDQAPALLQIANFGKSWLILLPVLLLAASFHSARDDGHVVYECPLVRSLRRALRHLHR
jgi:hypothetical protein